MPLTSNASIYQGGKAHYGHPNCRGSKLMAHAVVDRLYRAKAISRSLRLLELKPNVGNQNCYVLDQLACHTSAFCRQDPDLDLCVPYSAGSETFHRHPGLPNWAPGLHMHYL